MSTFGESREYTKVYTVCERILIFRLSALKHLQDLGVEILYRRDDEKLFEKGEEVTFDGFIVTEGSTLDKKEFETAEVRT